MSRILLTSTQVAEKVNLSSKRFNELLYEKKILNKRGRRSKKDPKKFKPYWDLIELKYGQNFPRPYFGGNTVRFYEDMVETMFADIGIGSLI